MQPLQNPFDLEGKTILVTGCNRGIGKAMAIALAQAGAEIIGVSTKLALTESQIEKDIYIRLKKKNQYHLKLKNFIYLAMRTMTLLQKK